jgi:ribosomal protein S18 acetylase RimI-like enzyme
MPAGYIPRPTGGTMKRETKKTVAAESGAAPGPDLVVSVRRLHRRDLNRTWEFLKRVFRDVNRETVEYQRPHSKRRFLETYEEEDTDQLLFETRQGARWEIVGYAECASEPTGSDSWINPRYFEKRDMRPLFVEELAVHPDYQGRGVGAFVLDQLEHLARVRGCTHLVLEVAENNGDALTFYRRRSFHKLDAALFMAKKVATEDELLPPRKVGRRRASAATSPQAATPAARARAPGSVSRPTPRRSR